MSFGLTNSPIKFMYLINKVFTQYIDTVLIVFIYNIMIYSQSEDELVHHIPINLQILKDH